MTDPVVRRWQPGWPCLPSQVLAQLRHGPNDPTYRVDGLGTIWRGVRTPRGPATLSIRTPSADGSIECRAWGDGAQWALDQAPAMLGGNDDVSDFEPRDDVIRALWHRFAHWRLGSSGLVMESLVPVIIEQKVTGIEAFASYRRLVRRFGERAPGPTQVDLWVPPTTARLRAIPSWEWLRLGIDHGRSQSLLRAAAVADALERAGRRGPSELDRALQSLRGIGVWTSAEVRFRVLGDADAVSFGDFHIAANVGFALTGRPTDDHGMAQLLEPYRPHRHRVQRLIELGGLRRPARAPRVALRSHLPTRLR